MFVPKQYSARVVSVLVHIGLRCAMQPVNVLKSFK